MSDFITKLSDMIDPEVMGDMVSARIPKKLRVAPFAKIDDTLAGVPGDTITVPAYTYIGDAADVAVCSIADAMYEFAQEDEARGLAKVSVGSVSETYTAPPQLCAATLALRAGHYRHEAGYYYEIGRWLLHA